eukprot:GFYU01004723.1.p1 GENE.GFYU01004723.1~~GFYU01004723.1.p1  ORF type:complete len:687 (+),score=218.34 GFYU01004723.1:187-2247(+)
MPYLKNKVEAIKADYKSKIDAVKRDCTSQISALDSGEKDEVKELNEQEADMAKKEQKCKHKYQHAQTVHAEKVTELEDAIERVHDRPYVAVYTDDGFAGTSQAFLPGSFTSDEIEHDCASSLRSVYVPPGFSVTIFELSNYKGRSIEIMHSVADLRTLEEWWDGGFRSITIDDSALQNFSVVTIRSHDEISRQKLNIVSDAFIPDDAERLQFNDTGIPCGKLFSVDEIVKPTGTANPDITLGAYIEGEFASKLANELTIGFSDTRNMVLFKRASATDEAYGYFSGKNRFDADAEVFEGDNFLSGAKRRKETPVQSMNQVRFEMRIADSKTYLKAEIWGIEFEHVLEGHLSTNLPISFVCFGDEGYQYEFHKVMIWADVLLTAPTDEEITELRIQRLRDIFNPQIDELRDNLQQTKGELDQYTQVYQDIKRHLGSVGQRYIDAREEAKIAADMLAKDLADECTQKVREATRERYFTPGDLAAHNSFSDCWVSVFNRCMDLTALLAEFQGQACCDPISKNAGRDVSHWFVQDENGDVHVRMHIDPESGVERPFCPQGHFIHCPPRDPDPLWRNDFGTPWWNDIDRFCVGRMSAHTRMIRCVNTLTGQEDVIEVCSEEIMEEILDRFLEYNDHCASYTWKRLGMPLEMHHTLKQSGVEDEGEVFYDMNIDDDYYIPALTLHFDDDLTVA